jgi:hypothetical protein
VRMTGEPSPETPGQWVSVAEAARRLGVTSRAIRSRIKHRTITFRPKGNIGREVFLPEAPPSPGEPVADSAALPGASAGAGDHPPPEPPPEGVELMELMEELAEERAARGRAEGELAAKDALVAELRETVAAERARADRLETALAEFRKPVLLRIAEMFKKR